MSDLISKAEVEKAIKEYFKMIIENTDDDVDCALDYSKNLGDAARGIPIAYDVDKVVKQLEEAKHLICLYGDDLEYYQSALSDAIDIVKRGGKDE